MMEKHQLPVLDYYIVHSNYQSDKVETYTRYLMNLPQRPEAIFAINDAAAIEMIDLIKKAGLTVPGDIAVLGFNNELFGKYTDPSLTTIDQPAHEMGEVAAELLIHEIHHPEARKENRVVKSKLVIRDSTKRIA